MDDQWFPLEAATGASRRDAAAARRVPPGGGARADRASGSNGSSHLDRARLREAAGAFEGEFIRLFLSAMRRTVPESGLFGKTGAPEKIWQDLMDRSLAEGAGRRSTLGLADLVVGALGPNVQKAATGAAGDAAGFLPLIRQPELSSLERHGAVSPLPTTVQPAVDRPASVDASTPVALPTTVADTDGAPARSDAVASGSARSKSATETALDSRLLARLKSHDGRIRRAARELGLDPNLVRAVMTAESGAQRLARSSRGALGLMQLMPGTARELGVKNPWNPDENLKAGARYLRSMLDRFSGDLELALAGYNAGPATVERYGAIPPFTETRSYIRRVLDLRQSLGRVFPDG